MTKTESFYTFPLGYKRLTRALLHTSYLVPQGLLEHSQPKGFQEQTLEQLLDEYFQQTDIALARLNKGVY